VHEPRESPETVEEERKRAESRSDRVEAQEASEATENSGPTDTPSQDEGGAQRVTERQQRQRTSENTGHPRRRSWWRRILSG
jgi:hypothetical protein